MVSRVSSVLPAFPGSTFPPVSYPQTQVKSAVAPVLWLLQNVAILINLFIRRGQQNLRISNSVYFFPSAKLFRIFIKIYFIFT